MTDYEPGTVALATVKGVKNVKVLRTNANGTLGWSFNPVPELGLVGSFAADEKNLVSGIELIDTPNPTPERAPYDITDMTPGDIEEALEEILGEGESPGHEYYDECTGINAFYHTLAGTGSYPEPKLPDDVAVGSYNGNATIVVPCLGTFITKDKVTEYMAETGDADTFVVFEFNGVHYKKQSYLDSYEGGVWDGTLHEVKPVQKTITVWEKA